MVIEVEALLPVGRSVDSHRGSLQLLPWQGDMGWGWAWGWMEVAEEGPAWSSPSPSWLDNRRMEARAASGMANVPMKLLT